MGGLSEEEIKDAKVILWQGHCSVHTRFTVNQIEAARERNSETTIIVHPECTQEVVAAADMYGSTELILETIAKAPAGSSWGVGTEISMVRRLAAENPDKDIFCLDPVVCPRATMYRIHPAYVLWVLEGIMAGLAINRIEVEPETQRNALVALERNPTRSRQRLCRADPNDDPRGSSRFVSGGPIWSDPIDHQFCDQLDGHDFYS